jgi:hypothetical protein
VKVEGMEEKVMFSFTESLTSEVSLAMEEMESKLVKEREDVDDKITGASEALHTTMEEKMANHKVIYSIYNTDVFFLR